MTRRTRRARWSVAMVATGLLAAACTSSSAGEASVADAGDPASAASVESATTAANQSTTATDDPEAEPMTNEPDTTTSTTAGTSAGTESSDAADVALSPQNGEIQASDGTETRCRRIFDFEGDAAGDQPGWVVVNDGVMGGRSNGVIEYVDSVMRFSGTVVTDGGGFTSIRHPLAGTEMAGSTSVSMRVRADGRVYGLTLEDDAEVGGRSVSHRADLDTSGDADADGWMIVTMDHSELQPSVFGRSVDAPPFEPDEAREFGIIIADATDGDFTLDIDWIDACN